MAISTPRLVALLSAAALAIAAWAFRYHYTTLRIGDTSYPVRTNRFTGRTELFRGQWVVPYDQGKPSTTRPLSDAPLDRLQFTGHLESYGWFKGRLYNGSSVTIDSVAVRGVAGRTDDGVRWSRVFSLAVNIPPGSSEDLLYEMKDAGLHEVRWTLEGARGHGDGR